MKNLLFLTLVFIFISGCKKEEAITQFNTDEMQALIPYDMLREHKTVHYFNEAGNTLVFDIAYSSQHNFQVLNEEEVQLISETFVLTRQGSPSDKITISLNNQTADQIIQVIRYASINLNSISIFGEPQLPSLLGFGYLTFNFPESIMLFNMNFFENLSFLNKQFKEVFTNILPTDPNELTFNNVTTKIYFTKEEGVIAFTAEGQSTWVLDRYEK